ncbi:MAG: hypothetical protein KA165_06745, partial [Saprospiraceae bacterium]|nr:hypothetical protein [Saprospiraceae bacterium]
TKADGLSDPLAITDAIFNDFSSDLCVTGESNTACLRYWGGWSSNNAFEQAACRSINAFLYDQDARCGEWVEFFQDILRLHGIRNEANPGNGLYGSNPVIMVAYTKKSSGPGYSNHGVLPAYKRQRLYDKLSNYFGSAFNPGSPFNQSNSVYLPEGYGSGSDINVVGEFYIREMNFNDIYQNDNGENKLYLVADANAAPLIIQGNPVPYNQIKGCDSAGVPGQGNGNPKSFFWNHVFVNYVGKYFDPSYGVTKDSKSQYVNDNVEGFGCQVVYKNPNLIQIPLLWLDDKISTADHSDFFGD